MFFFGETTQRWDILSLIESLQFNYSIKCNVSSVGISSLNRQRETMFPSYEGPTQGLLYYPYRQYTNLFIFRFASQNTPYTLRLLRLNYPSTSHPLYINKYFDIIRSIYKQIRICKKHTNILAVCDCLVLFSCMIFVFVYIYLIISKDLFIYKGRLVLG